MKSVLLFLLVLITVSFSFAQKYNREQKIIISSHIDSLLKGYLQKSTLLEVGTIKRSDAILREYKSLFASDAMIFDDINPVFDSLETVSNPYKLVSKPLNEYYKGLVRDFPLGFIVNNRKLNINYSELESNIVKVALERNIKGTNAVNYYKLSNHDTLLLTLQIEKDLSVKIINISSLSKTNNLKVLNDNDLDGVINDKDRCPDEKGKRGLNGCPDRDNDGIADRDDDCPSEFGPKSNQGCEPSTFTYSVVLSGTIGYQINKHILSMPTSGFGYEQMDKVKSTFGKVRNPGVKPSLALNLNLAYYFGKKKFKKNFGVAGGVFITNYNDDYLISGVKYYFKSSDGVDSYRRIVTLDNARENISFSMLDISLQLKYRGKLKNTKFATEIGIGPGYITSINSYKYNAKLDYEGIYQFNKNTGHWEYSQSFVEQKENLILEGDFIDQKGNGSDANTAYLLLQNASRTYDFGLNKSFETSSRKTLASRSGFAINANVDILYHLSSKIAAKVGASIIYANLTNKNKNYKMADEVSNKYTSITESNAKSNYFSWGIGVGISLGI